MKNENQQRANKKMKNDKKPLEKSSRTIRVAVGLDELGWHEKFIHALNEKISAGMALEVMKVNLEAHDWLKQIEDADLILWKPNYMGIKSASYFKEKIYFLQYIAGKVVVPNFQTIWHFESKVAQSYLFSHYGIKCPHTVVSMDYNDAKKVCKESKLPLVFKLSYGAGSKNVQLVNDQGKAQGLLRKIFCVPIYNNEKRRLSSGAKVMLRHFWKKWLWHRTMHRLYEEYENAAASYFQEFIPMNTADLRITVIGDRFAFGFWRNNRPGDFRASGSGLIDFKRSIPEEALKYCFELNRKMNFDAMCYDLLFSKDGLVITEISYGTKADVSYNTKGYFSLQDGTLTFHEGHFWLQQFWVEWALLKIGSQVQS